VPDPDRLCARCGHAESEHDIVYGCGVDGCPCTTFYDLPAPPRELSAVTGAFIAGCLAGAILAAIVWSFVRG
jgi:hypothetical protein